MTEQFDMSFKQALYLRRLADKEMEPLLTVEHEQTKQLVDEMKDDLSCVDETLDIVKSIPVPRTHSGWPGKPYLDAILRMIDGLTEVLEGLIMALKFYLKAIRKIREYWNKFMQWLHGEDESKKKEEEAKNWYQKAIDKLKEFIFASGARIEMFLKMASEPIRRQFMKTLTAGQKARLKSKVELMQARNEWSKASDYKVENVIVWLEGKLATAKAIYKLIAVVRRTINWMWALIHIDPVAFLPWPITGWMILNIYRWWTGDEFPDILKPVVINVMRGNFDPVTIVQGVLKTPTVSKVIPAEAYTIAKMPFLGGGTVF